MPDNSESNSPDISSEVKFEAATKKKRETRPWGSYEIMTSGPGFQTKRLTVTAE